MTFTEIVNMVGERLNLTSTDAIARIGRSVNDRYRRVTSSVGLGTARRATSTKNTVIGDPTVVFDLEKIEIVYMLVNGKRRVLDERSYDEWRSADTWVPRTGTPEWYAIRDTGSGTTTIVLSHTPTAIEELRADGLTSATTLSGSNVPAFPADFHDALVYGAMANEYRKMQNPVQAKECENDFDERVSELRYFIAKSVYLKQFQQSDSVLNRPPYRRSYGYRS